jgi:hypothetical protein
MIPNPRSPVRGSSANAAAGILFNFRLVTDMTFFIRAEQQGTNSKVWLNVDEVLFFQPSDEGTSVHTVMGGATRVLLVNQSVHEILAQVPPSYLEKTGQSSGGL